MTVPTLLRVSMSIQHFRVLASIAECTISRSCQRNLAKLGDDIFPLGGREPEHGHASVWRPYACYKDSVPVCWRWS